MNTPTLLSVLLLGSLVSGAALAQTDPNQAKATAPAPGVVPAGCLQDTGSRLPKKATKCAAAGNSHSGEDLSKTGKPSVGDALKMVDPAVTVTNR